MLKLLPGQVDIRIVSTSAKYRALARQLPLKTDSVLEIGCSTGKTTSVLARCAGHVLAVDIDVALVLELKAEMTGYDHVKVTRIDGRLGADLSKEMPHPHIIFIDVGGNAPMDNAATVMRQCLRTFTPRILVVRNIELAGVCALVTGIEPPDNWHLRRIDLNDSLGVAFTSLLELSRSSQRESRLLAARKLRRLGTPEALERLKEMLGDEDGKIRRVAGLGGGVE